VLRRVAEAVVRGKCWLFTACALTTSFLPAVQGAAIPLLFTKRMVCMNKKGYETAVLLAAGAVLGQIIAVLLEMSFTVLSFIPVDILKFTLLLVVLLLLVRIVQKTWEESNG